MIVIEMNPRVSRSSALASKATGFPIAKIAAKLAVGYTLDEIPNDITRETMASFEPTIDYCVVKIPRWTFEKFPETEDFLTTSMKSVGETMAIGRTFQEALQKAIRSLEIKRFGLMIDLPEDVRHRREFLEQKLTTPNSLRLFYIAAAFRHGMTIEEIQRLTRIDPWFLHQIRTLVEAEEELEEIAALDGDPPRGEAAGIFRPLSRRSLEPSGGGDPPAAAMRPGSSPSTSSSTPARRSSRPTPPTTTPPTRRRTRPDPRRSRRSSSSAAAPTGSARGSSSTTAASTPPSPCARRGTRASWSTPTRRR